jgi:hypothetical protein
MELRSNFLLTRTTGKCLLCSMALSVFLAVAPIFGDDQQVLDELYNEIMSSSLREQGTIDSGASKSVPLDRLNIDPVMDQNSEYLRQEIEKMVEEAKVRHSDAVRFMQESR